MSTNFHPGYHVSRFWSRLCLSQWKMAFGNPKLDLVKINCVRKRQGLHVRLHEINAFLYIHILVSTGISLLYVNEYIHVYLYVYTSSYRPCMYILISRKWEYVVVVYCVSISVCTFIGNVPRSPKLRVYRDGVMCLYLRMYICRYCPHVPKSPNVRVYRGCILCLYIRIYIRRYCPRPQVSKNESV